MKHAIMATIVIAFLGISNHSSAQVRLGAVANARLTTAASVNTPAVNNALRASARTTTNIASKSAHAAEHTTAATARSAEHTTAATAAAAKNDVHAVANTKVSAKASVSAH